MYYFIDLHAFTFWHLQQSYLTWITSSNIIMVVILHAATPICYDRDSECSNMIQATAISHLDCETNLREGEMKVKELRDYI